jgi:hypothetical protein
MIAKCQLETAKNLLVIVNSPALQNVLRTRRHLGWDTAKAVALAEQVEAGVEITDAGHILIAKIVMQICDDING